MTLTIIGAVTLALAGWFWVSGPRRPRLTRTRSPHEAASWESSPAMLSLAVVAAGMGAVYAIGSAFWVVRQPVGAEALQAPHRAIRDAATAFMRVQYGTVAGVGAALFVVLWATPEFGFFTALGFLVGGVCSALAGIAGMSTSVRANVRTAAAAEQGTLSAMTVAYRAGTVTGFLVGGLVLGSTTGFYLLLESRSHGPVDLAPLAGLAFGASLISIFSRLGGGIFTKAADVGADLAGKLDVGIPEDDPRNPAVIADNVGDNVGDCAGMAADVFETYVVTLVAAMLVADGAHQGDPGGLELPLALGGAALVAGLIGAEVVQRARTGPLAALTAAVVATTGLAAGGFYLVTAHLLPSESPLDSGSLFWSAIVGLGVGMGMVGTTDYFTGTGFAPVQRIATASGSGHATNVIAGMAVGMKSTVVPVSVIAAGIITAHQLAGVYGIALAAVGLLSLAPVVISIDAFGPVVDNAGGIVEMAAVEGDARAATDALDAVGNTTKALTKVFSVGSAGLAALALFVAFELDIGGEAGGSRFSLDDPHVLAGLFVGSMLPFVFSGYAMEAVGRTAARIVHEVRRQFEENPAILEGTELPDYALAVQLLTRASIGSMVLPALLPVVVPSAVVAGFVWFGPDGSAAQTMGGMLIGAVGTGLLLALFLSTAGAAWDNAKKYVEAGHVGGKGSPAHDAAITGDTVGDPCKDTAGPAINPMLKVLSVMALLLSPFM